MSSCPVKDSSFQGAHVVVRDRPSPHLRQFHSLIALPLLMALVPATTGRGQSPETPMTRLRPIGEPSAVDQIVRTYDQEPSPDGVRHAAWMQFQLPTGSGVPTTAPPTAPSDASMIPPPSLGTTGPPVSGTVLGPSTTPAPPTLAPAPTTMPPYQGAPTMAPPRGLPMNPGYTVAPPIGTSAVPGTGDLLPVAPPQLNDQFATIDNCSCVSPPSGYVAATGWTQPTPSTSYVATPAPSAYIAPTSVVAPAGAPVATVPVIPDASTMPKGSGVPRHSVVSFGQDRNPIVVGQGIVGQPVAYVPGQPVRNWIRWLFP